MRAIAAIALLGEPILRQQAQSIKDVSAPNVRELAEAMLLALNNADGVGLAAPQIFEALRLMVVASRPNKRYPYAPEMSATVMMNPTFRPLGDEKVKDWEGCLSIPGIRALVPRYQAIQVSYYDLEGQRVQVDLQGFVARVFQHEYDHLDGLVYLDRVENNRDIISEPVFLKLMLKT